MAGSGSVLFSQWIPVFELQWHCWSGLHRQNNYDLGFSHWCCFVKSDIPGKRSADEYIVVNFGSFYN